MLTAMAAPEPVVDLAAHYEQRHGVYATFGTGLVGENARRLLPPDGSALDIGCASGGLLRLLRPVAGQLAGLEPSPTAAARAAEVADEVLCGGLDAEPAPEFRAAPFDLVICADVLEHLVDPLAGLRRAIGWCRPGGAVLISVPNIGHFTARWRVARGRFGYDEDGGIFDVSHLHFFTQALLVELVTAAGLTVESMDAVVPRLQNTVPVVRRLPARGARLIERQWQRLGDRRPDLLGYQLVAVGRVGTDA